MIRLSERRYLREQYGRIEQRTPPKLVYAFLLFWFAETATAVILIGMGDWRLNESTHDRQLPDDALPDGPETFRDAVVSLLIFTALLALLIGLGVIY